ncbi:uncharacterized protein DUF3383 [Serratia fonticola]|jgi:hypothetical protein|uniref:Uncharacterized protein DUF3383 n=1 Tax=Serratia fonticola TaxID=47917 RepID=A0A542D4G6_SERFO|nr:DUF3383 family protein [Serratia fonticola]TQI79996.1 uncharacterized protein DUF3383 [Serratia fonticola]TQI97978.1 uncharacterized protein DUF3383 [Serratia fonticola]TVZ72473.1 uncharacterized protein DUF3383 [Serratia fonticola]
MSISLNQYVKITSGVGAGNNVRAREQILRIFTENTLVPSDGVLEFTSADDVASYFGRDAQEYLRAVKYFSYISPTIVQPSKLSFARDQHIAAPSRVIGEPVRALSQASGVIAGTINGVEFTTASVTIAEGSTMHAAAVSVEEALNAVNAVPALVSSKFSYEPVNARFLMVAGDTQVATIKFKAGAVTDALGLTNGTAIPGVAEPLVEADSVSVADNISNNYGSFLFLRKLALDEVIPLAEANAAKNVSYMLLVGCEASEAESFSAALLPISSVGLTLIAAPNTDFDEQIPGALMAATNYDSRNGVINYMYRQVPNITPKVTTTPMSDFYDNLRVNYYGRTQTAGQQIDFYQRGVLTGGATAPTDMNVHANEQWLKDICAAALLSLQLSLGRIPANKSGRGQILNTLQTPIDSALFNGVISVDKPLNTQQKLYITQMTGDDNAWQQVQGIGYWVDAFMQSIVTPDGRTEWQCVYTLIYSKDDAIRRVVGTHALI